MALQLALTNVRTGHSNSYWRLTGVNIDSMRGFAVLVLSGYADAAARQAGRSPDDFREWVLDYAAFESIAMQPSQGSSVYDAVAIAAYNYIVQTRRPIPQGTVMNTNGSVLLPNGETVAAADVDMTADTPTVPSEFASALAV